MLAPRGCKRATRLKHMIQLLVCAIECYVEAIAQVFVCAEELIDDVLLDNCVTFSRHIFVWIFETTRSLVS